MNPVFLHDHLLPWHTNLWPALVSQSAKGGGLLIHGPSGHGKRHLARRLAVSLLCEQPAPDGQPCGRCAGCLLCRANQHPDWVEIATEQHWDDFVRLRTDEADADGADRTDSGAGEKETRKARDIRIADVRRLERLTTLSAHRGGRRVVLIWPADEMTVEASNALLKTLEEPGHRLHFILVSAHPERLLPTVRSRVRLFEAPGATREEARQWLQSQDVDDADAVLGLATGAPLKAKSIASESDSADSVSVRDAFVRWLLETAPSKMLERPAGFDKMRLGVILQLMILTGFELLRCAEGALPVHLTHLSPLLQPGRRALDSAQLHHLLRDCLQMMVHAEHPLNVRMQLDQLSQRWFEALHVLVQRRTA